MVNGVNNSFGLAVWLAASFAAGGIGSRFMPGEWYASLTKPSWTPPNAVFGPVWSTLYVLMGVAAWLVWRRQGFSGAGAALGIFLIQLVLNALWSYLFFGRHRPDIAFVEILLLWAAIFAATVLFWRTDRMAGTLMVPYLAWVSLASALNFSVWRLNQ